ncbi:MAG: hypothetical protein GWN61_26570 [candidate division Zixibacteria bacterium]|nr:hypothetical protein [candidate division Zixibacteria bacterium]NIV09638.1 hypothetical protein [candidate division Zixibacteria bacterium]
MPDRIRKYHQASLTYLVYGVIYLVGAIHLVKSGFSGRAMGSGNGLIYFIIGALIVVVFPLLIWKGFKWFTRILAVLVVTRMIGLVQVIFENSTSSVPLPWGAELPMLYGAIVFLAVTAFTCFMLVRAGWDI